MTTVVLAPPATAAVVSSPTATTTTNNNNNSNNNSPAAVGADAAKDAQRAANIDDESPELDLEPEVEEKENEERSGNNNNTVADSRGEALVADCATTASAKTAVPSKPVSAPDMRYKKRPRVSFESADIVEFEPTLYTTTVTSGGIPVGMSFTERSRCRRRLDSWELERTDARVGRQSYMEEGYLDPTERESILNKTGYDDSTMVVVEAEVNRIIADRRESNEVDFEFMYGLGEVDDSLVEEDDDEEEEEEEEEEDDGGNQQHEPEDGDGNDNDNDDDDNNDEENEEAGEEEEETAREAALTESSSGFSSEEENEDDRTRA